MRFYGYHVLSPEENMFVDSRLFKLVEDDLSEPVFRIYRWSELCVSIGKNQEKRDFPVRVVRRPTGGGALLHGWDLSFAVVDYKENWGDSPLKIYRKFTKVFRILFGVAGVRLEVEKNRTYALDDYFCFFFPTFGELKTCDGRKVVAMAMCEGKRAFLLHGSVYLNFDYGRAEEILGVKEELLRSRVVSLQELGVNPEEFKQLLYFCLSSLPCRA
ncbi:MAG: lipoate--protein ligase [Aquificae bacterium]|nr:lipoate--protein ligase [Aquificota bacterium]